MDRQNINNITNLDDVHGLFLIHSATQATARNGIYWRLELKDATGKMEAKIWSPMAQEFVDIKAGQFIQIDAKAASFNEQVQLNISRARIFLENEIENLDYADFLPTSKTPPNELYLELKALIKKYIHSKAWKRLIYRVINNPEIKRDLLLSTAAKSVHHAYIGGLLEHQIQVGKLTMQIVQNYSGLDTECLFTAAIFHDIGKTIELSTGLVNDYTNQGRLVGHIVLGLEILEPYIKKSGLSTTQISHFKHLILSHHGEREFGSPIVPLTKEAFILHYADNIDAKLAQFNNLFSGNEEIEWSPYQKLLERHLCSISKQI